MSDAEFPISVTKGPIAKNALKACSFEIDLPIRRPGETQAGET